MTAQFVKYSTMNPRVCAQVCVCVCVRGCVIKYRTQQANIYLAHISITIVVFIILQGMCSVYHI